MKIETKTMLAEAFKVSVRKFVKAGSHARWGEAESLGVVSDMVDAMNSDEDAQAEGFDCIRGYVRKVINPSAQAQILDALPKTGYDETGEKVEGGKFAHPASITRPKRAEKEAKTEVVY
jgi:hypothetical protein